MRFEMFLFIIIFLFFYETNHLGEATYFSVPSPNTSDRKGPLLSAPSAAGTRLSSGTHALLCRTSAAIRKEGRKEAEFVILTGLMRTRCRAIPRK